jgi:hypothetical protein
MIIYSNQTLLHSFYFTVNSKLAAYKKNKRPFSNCDMPNIGHRGCFDFKATSKKPGLIWTIFLHTHSYYQIRMKCIGKADSNMLNRIK